MKKQSDFHKTVQNLMLLDPESLLLIDIYKLHITPNFNILIKRLKRA